MYTPEAELLQKINSWIKEGKGLTAWDAVKDLPPLKTWRGKGVLPIAARLAQALGNQQLSSALDWIHWREDRENEKAYFQALFFRLQHRSPCEFIPEIEQRLKRAHLDHHRKADLLTFLGWCYSTVREFTKAHQLIDEAMELRPNFSWFYVERSAVFSTEDKYLDALEASKTACELRPNYRPAVLSFISNLIQLGRDDEAILEAKRACQASDQPAFPLQLHTLLSERDLTDDCRKALAEYERKCPLMSASTKDWLMCRQADFYYLDGDHKKFLELAHKTKKDGYYQLVANHFKQAPSTATGRKKLHVEFIRQHNMTCAPATMAAIAQYFGKNHDHLKIADAICYEGTPWHKERDWCENNGFVTKEFLVTAESTKALIDAGIPFTLTTIEVTSAHLQACIGYDDNLGAIILRDPTHRHYGEAILSKLIEKHPISGPRGMLMIPTDQAHLLDSIDLPETETYNLYYQFHKAIENHDTETAEATIHSFISHHPDSPLRHKAAAILANYQNNPTLHLQEIDCLLKRFPKTQSLIYQKFNLLTQLSRYSEAKALLASVRKEKDSDPIFLTEEGELLASDYRTADAASYYLRKAILLNPYEGRTHAAYAYCLSTLNKKEEALRYRRSASRLNPSFEPYASDYYESARWLRQDEEGIHYLRERANDLGKKEIEPHLTLLDALSEKNSPEAATMAEQLLTRFPENGKLLLKTCRLFSNWGRTEDARSHLQNAKGQVREIDRLRTSAQFESWCGDRSKSVALWRQLLETTPLSIAAYDAIALHISEEEGRSAAVDFLAKAVDQNPDFIPLLKSYVEWLEYKGPDTSIPVLQRILKLDPNDLWTERELALEFSRAKHNTSAIEHAKNAVEQNPHNAISWNTLGLVYSDAGQQEEAVHAQKKAITLAIDVTQSIKALINLASNFKERTQFLQFIREELIAQVSNGSGIQEYATQAYRILDPEELLTDLQSFCHERPDLWETWSSLKDHASAMNKPELAKEAVDQMVERFPLLPRSWMELGFIHRASGQVEEEEAAFYRATQLSPSWDWALKEWATSLESLGRYDEAVEALDRTIHSDPLMVSSHGYKADLLWKLGSREEAFDTLIKGIKIGPFYNWGWEKLDEWAKTLNSKEHLVQCIEEITADRKHIARWWKQLSDIHLNFEDNDKSLHAIEKALELEPDDAGFIEHKAHLLTNKGRYDEALQLCHTEIQKKRPLSLRGREAWILMQLGEGEQAWELMKTIADEEPDYYWAQYQLAQWASDISSYEHLKTAATQLVRLQPENAISWGWLAKAEQELNHDTEALQAFTKAFRLDPTYTYAGRNKLRIEKEHKNFTAAQKTLSLLEHHIESSFLTADALSIGLLLNDDDEIETRWEQILQQAKELDEDPFAYIEGFWEKTGEVKDYYSRLKQRIQDGKTASYAEASAWGRHISGSSNFSNTKKFFKMTLQSSIPEEYKASSLLPYIETITSYDNRETLSKFIRKHHNLLSSHYRSWSGVLSAFASVPLEKDCIQWAKDWKTFRDEVSPTDLASYAACIDSQQSIEEGYALRREALEKFPDWQDTEILRLCTALYDATSSRYEQAKQLFSGFTKEDINNQYYELLFHLTKSVMYAHDGDLENAKSSFEASQGIRKSWTKDKAIKRYSDISAQTIAQELKLFKGNGKTLTRKWGSTFLENYSQYWWILLAIIIIIIRYFD